MELRDYQKDIVSKVLNSSKNEVIGLPTGSGKTVIAKAIIDGLKGTVVFCAPRIDLVLQSSDTFGDVDVIWSSRTSVTGKHCIVASKQSLVNQFSKLPDGDITMIFDECHIGMQKNRELAELIKPKRVIGLTATPETMAGNSFIKGSKFDRNTGLYDEVNYYYPITALQKMGYLAPLVCHYYDYKSICKVKVGTFDEELRGKAFRDFIGGKEGAIAWSHLSDALSKCSDKPTIIFTPDIETANKVSDFAKKQNYDYRVITGEATVEERAEAYKQLADHSIHGLVNAALLTYGFDCPAAKNIILFRHLKSRPLYVQIVGRALRPYNNETAHLYDVLDSNSEFIGINQRDMFSQPIDWRYEGFDAEEAAVMSEKDRERLQTHLARDPEWVDWYNKSPIEALWSLYEDTIDKAEERYFAFTELTQKSADERVASATLQSRREIEKAKAKVFEAQEKAKAAAEDKMSYYLAQVFIAEQKFIVPQTLRSIKYDYTEYNMRKFEALEAIWNALPAKYKEPGKYDETDVAKLHRMCDWWLKNFKLNWKPFKTTVNDDDDKVYKLFKQQQKA